MSRRSVRKARGGGRADPLVFRRAAHNNEDDSMKKLLSLSLALAVCAAPVVPAFAADPPEKKPEKKQPDPAEQFKRLDKNTDGKLTLEEFKGKREEAQAKKAFERIDTNKDGGISLEEFKAFREKQKKKTAGSAPVAIDFGFADDRVFSFYVGFLR
jgi:hypothetical protein